VYSVFTRISSGKRVGHVNLSRRFRGRFFFYKIQRRKFEIVIVRGRNETKHERFPETLGPVDNNLSSSARNDERRSGTITKRTVYVIDTSHAPRNTVRKHNHVWYGNRIRTRLRYVRRSETLRYSRFHTKRSGADDIRDCRTRFPPIRLPPERCATSGRPNGTRRRCYFVWRVPKVRLRRTNRFITFSAYRLARSIVSPDHSYEDGPTPRPGRFP